MQRFPNSLITILDALDPTLQNSGFFDCVIANTFMPMACLTKIMDQINRGISARGNGQAYQFNTVQTLYLSAAQKQSS
ncbi:hypothetical protein [Paraburkholderia sediminicola]|uniref:hypothetical protein n=1 Tax=Paraburkholderia sediminicola TaxID=458836 RepID=UPI0038BAFBF3